MARYSTSTFWQLERAQTELRMRHRHAQFWRPVIGVVWLLSTGVYLWMGIGEVGRGLFWPWVNATFWGWIWPRHVVLFHGRWYEPQTLAAWLQQTVYGNSLSSWLFEAVLIGMLPALACVLALLGYARRRAQEPTGEEHIRGVKLLSPRQLQEQLQGPRSWWPWWQTSDTSGVSVAGVSLPRELETNHVLITGSTGTGKSTILRGLLRQIARRGETAIVLDPECELTPEFYDPNRHDVILNPTDARCPFWSPWLELAAEGDTQTLATSVVPDPPERSSGTELYFVNSARELFVALLARLPQHDPHELSRVLFGPVSRLLTLIENTPAASHVIADAPDQRGGVISTLQIALRGFRFLPPESPHMWSARTWHEQRQGWLFLPCRESDRAAILSLQSVWLDILIRRLLDTDLARAHHERVWIVIDELATVRRLQHLEDILTRGRKRGVSVVLGFQAVPQLRTLYGRDTTATLLAAPAVKLLLRTGEPETARWCSEAIGKREVIRPVESETAGPEDTRDAISVSYQRKEEAVVLAAEIQQLPALQGYLSVAGYDVAAVRFPVLTSEGNQPGFIPRTPSHDPSQTAPPPITAVPAAPPRVLVMKPRPVSTEKEPEGDASLSSSPVTPDDISPVQQLDLFPVEQKRKL